MDFLPIYFLIVFAYLKTGEAIHCFQCSFNDAGCEELKANDTSSPYYQECKPSAHGNPILCRKIRVKILDPDIPWRIYRSCGYMTNHDEDNYCVESDSDFKKERSCECRADGCNSSPPCRTITLLSIVLPAAAVFIKGTNIIHRYLI